MSGLRHLTLRGRCLLAAGVTAGLVGLALSERDLVRIAVVLVALPLLGLAATSRTRFRLTSARRVEPARVSAGARSRITLVLENVSWLPTGLLLVEDTIPYLLGGRHRAVVNRLPPRRPVDIGYDVRADTRGRYALGPLTIRLMDPFGLCEIPRSFTSTDTLVVTPRVTPLPGVRLAGEWVGAGESTARSVATSGEDDAATREYRQGDDLRRIHWRSTARRGALTVRREEQPWQSRGAVLLDTRVAAHAGEGAGSSFEWAVSAAASIGVHLSRSGFELRLVTDTGAEVSSAGGGAESFDSALLDGLAVIQRSGNHGLQLGVGALRRHGGEGLLIAVLGALNAADAEQLARLRAGGRALGVAILLDTPAWDPATANPARVAAERERVQALLGQAGWRTVVADPSHSLADVWAAAGSAGPTTAVRSVVAGSGAA